MKEEINAINHFKVTDLPPGMEKKNYKSKYTEILMAVSKLGNGKTITMSLEEWKEMFSSSPKVTTNIKQYARKRYKMRLGIAEREGTVYVFNRGETN